MNRLGYVNKKLRIEQELNRHINTVVDEINAKKQKKDGVQWEEEE